MTDGLLGSAHRAQGQHPSREIALLGSGWASGALRLLRLLRALLAGG